VRGPGRPATLAWTDADRSSMPLLARLCLVAERESRRTSPLRTERIDRRCTRKTDDDRRRTYVCKRGRICKAGAAGCRDGASAISTSRIAIVLSWRQLGYFVLKLAFFNIWLKISFVVVFFPTRHALENKVLRVCANFFLLQTEQEYVDSGRPHAVQTAQAMLALLYAGQV
jgi:hypothetical protein